MPGESRCKAAPFREWLLAGQHLFGTFVKTPTAHATEILGAVGFDFVVVDEEHAPFDRAATQALAEIGALSS